MNPFPGIHQPGGNSMMEMVKTYLLTSTMVSSLNNNNGNNGNNNNGNKGLYSMLWVLVVTGIMEWVQTSLLPLLRTVVTKWYKEKKRHLVPASLVEAKSKTASITVVVNIADHENIIGQALLDAVTNHSNTRHISYKKQNFVLNQSDVIEIAEDIWVKLSETKTLEHDESLEQTLELSSYSLCNAALRAFLTKTAHEYRWKIENKLGDKKYYFNLHPMTAPVGSDGSKDFSRLPNNCVFTMKRFQTNRQFTNLFGPQMEAVRKRVEFFVKHRKWYDAKGIPYTLGILLSGQAGAGKTSTIKCLANETNRHIINLNLANDVTKTQLENLFFNELLMVLNVSTGQTEKYYIPLDQRIYVLEDLDCQGGALVRERNDAAKEADLQQGASASTSASASASFLTPVKTNPHKPDTYQNAALLPQQQQIDLSFLLNLLDGVLELPGRIVIMTSNYPERLDRALIRPGRIDVLAAFTKCTHQTVCDMMSFFYDTTLTSDQRAAVLSTPSYLVSPAELSKLLFAHFEDLDGAIAHLVRGIDNETPEEQSTEEEEKKEKEEKEEKEEEDLLNVLSYNDRFTTYTML